MRSPQSLPIPAIVAGAVLVAGLVGIWRGLSQEPVGPRPAVPVELARQPVLAPPRPSPPDEAAATHGELAGKVVLPDGKPAPGAKVRAVPAAYVGKPALVTPRVPGELAASADPQGAFRFEVSLSWSYSVHAEKDALSGVKVDVVPPAADVVVPLTGSQRVAVTVTEQGGAKKVAGIPVGLTAEGQVAVSFEGVTSGAGEVVFERVPLGRYRAEAVEHAFGKAATGAPLARERRRAQATFAVQADAPATVVLDLGGLGKVKGRVTAPAGVDLSQLVVYAVPASVTRAMRAQVYGAQVRLLPSSYASARVAADGRFELAEVSGPLGLLVPHPSLTHRDAPATPDGPEVTIALLKDQVVKGRVVDAAGKPVERFAVNGTEFASPSGNFEHAPGGPPGTERPKNLPLIVTASGFAPLEKQLALGPGENDVGTLVLQPGRTLTLTVVDDATGAPIDELTFARLDGTALASEPAEEVAPGVHRFFRLPPGPVTLSATRFGGANRKIQIAAGETDKTFRFGSGATVRGVVRGPGGKPAVGARVFPSGELGATRLTDEGGRFSLAGRESGPLTLVVMFGRTSAIKKVDVPQSGEVSLEIDLGTPP